MIDLIKEVNSALKLFFYLLQFASYNKIGRVDFQGLIPLHIYKVSEFLGFPDSGFSFVNTHKRIL